NEDRYACLEALERPTILAMNKSDLPAAQGLEFEEERRFAGRVKTSALTGSGISDLKDALIEAALGDASPSDGMMATERMIGALEKALECMEDAREAIDQSRGADVVGSLLAEAAEFFAEPGGANASGELLDAVFGTFCVGK
ncbi:MAG: tRNA uridine-5-carboxymethylaminomethyl(34) synthesis GTPase MnmE, partial [Synergistaceae bacterium]|nr:tRNA uridine-5-carboxymethylaminomethyl(34) synthesis GTPase MnmE [Synergistaceae bacterium]